MINHDLIETERLTNPTTSCIQEQLLTNPTTDYVREKAPLTAENIDCVQEEVVSPAIITLANPTSDCVRKKLSFTAENTDCVQEEAVSPATNTQVVEKSLLDTSLIESTSSTSEEDGSNDYAISCSAEYPTRMRLTKLNSKRPCPSPLQSDYGAESVDDSDKDPNFTCSSSHGSTSIEEENDIQAESKVQKKRGKKRECEPHNWIAKKSKIMRNSGKSYVSSSKTRKAFKARKVRPPCGKNCRLRCIDKINETIRHEIFDNYWNLGILQRQREFIVAHTEPIKPKYRYSSTQELRNLNSAFYFEVNKKRTRVCKKFFKSTLDINDRPIRTTLKKRTETGFVKEDMRGKHDKHPTVDPEIKDSVRNFINSIPRIESHYLRAQTTREFIESGKNLADLHRDYKETRENQHLPFANSVMFNRIFNREFNISFYVPKKDQCDLCESYKNADEEGKKGLVNSYNQHQEEKELSRKEKNADKKKPNVAVYDLQAVMPLPKGLVSSFYYKSKINCYNFTVSDLYAKHAECFFWTEVDAKRGAVEIGSCVLRYIELLVKNADNAEGLDITFYSDNCCGQQKNKYILAMYSYAVAKYNLGSITHKFLIHGHSQNEGDNIHSVIEKQVKRHMKSAPIYVPEQYVTLISIAKKTGSPYRVHLLTYDDFYDLKGLQEEWGANFNVDIDKKKLKWNDIKVMKVEKENPDAFFYKTSYKDLEFKKVKVQNNMKNRSSKSWESIRLTKAYTERVPLPENKKRDIKHIAEKNIIPKNYFNSYYKDVLNLS